jgi:hypothetical protein
MTALLEKAFARASTLPKDGQEAIILEEIASEAR